MFSTKSFKKIPQLTIALTLITTSLAATAQAETVYEKAAKKIVAQFAIKVIKVNKTEREKIKVKGLREVIKLDAIILALKEFQKRHPKRFDEILNPPTRKNRFTGKDKPINLMGPNTVKRPGRDHPPGFTQTEIEKPDRNETISQASGKYQVDPNSDEGKKILTRLWVYREPSKGRAKIYQQWEVAGLLGVDDPTDTDALFDAMQDWKEGEDAKSEGDEYEEDENHVMSDGDSLLPLVVDSIQKLKQAQNDTKKKHAREKAKGNVLNALLNAHQAAEDESQEQPSDETKQRPVNPEIDEGYHGSSEHCRNNPRLCKVKDALLLGGGVTDPVSDPDATENQELTEDTNGLLFLINSLDPLIYPTEDGQYAVKAKWEYLEPTVQKTIIRLLEGDIDPIRTDD